MANENELHGKHCRTCEKFSWYRLDNPVCEHCGASMNGGGKPADGMLSVAEQRDLERYLGPAIKGINTYQGIKQYLKENRITDCGRT